MTDISKDAKTVGANGAISADMYEVFACALVGADRVVIETKNALGEMDAHYLHAPSLLSALPQAVTAADIEAGVRDLVWERSGSEKHEGCVEYAETCTGTYFIGYDNDDFTGYYCDFVSMESCTWFGTGKAKSTEIGSHHRDDDLSPIKAAANAHHRATVLSAFDLSAIRATGHTDADLRAAVEAEREACLLAVDAVFNGLPNKASDAIRARATEGD